MTKISSGRQEPAFQHISFWLQGTQSRDWTTLQGEGETQNKSKEHTVIKDHMNKAKMEFHWLINFSYVINSGPD